MVSKVLFSSLCDDVCTPMSLFARLDAEFNFDFDPCPQHPKFDGLKVEWGERCFVNPPYSQVAKWIRKGYEESVKGKLCVFLVASRTDTRWFHDYVLKFAKEIRFVKGRVKFVGYDSGAPFPSCVVVFDGRGLVDG